MENLGVTVVQERFAGNAVNDPVTVEGLLTTICGATTTLTDSLFNMTNVEPKLITIQLAMDCNNASHSCWKQDILRVRQIWNTQSNLYTSILCQRIETRSSRRKSTCSIKLSSYSWQVSGIYAVSSDGTIDPANSFPFVSENSDWLFFLQTSAISAQKYEKMSGYSLWHRRLSHCPNDTIRKTIDHVIGMDELKKEKFDSNEQCSACMMGKAQLKAYPK